MARHGQCQVPTFVLARTVRSTSHSPRQGTPNTIPMLVNENINVNKDCARMPAGDDTGKGSVTFTNVKVNGKVPEWTTRANCKGNTQCDCDNSADVSSTGDVTLGWNTGKSAHESITV